MRFEHLAVQQLNTSRLLLINVECSNVLLRLLARCPGIQLSYRLTSLLMTWYKEMGHDNYKKGLGFSALAPSFPRSRCVAVGSERPARGVVRFLGLLLLQELPNAFVTFLDA